MNRTQAIKIIRLVPMRLPVGQIRQRPVRSRGFARTSAELCWGILGNVFHNRGEYSRRVPPTLESYPTGGRSATKQLDDNEPVVLSTAERLAKEYHVSPDTIKRAGWRRTEARAGGDRARSATRA